MEPTNVIRHTERGRRTHELLLEAHRLCDGPERTALLDEVILLNRGVAEAVANRYRGRGVAIEDLHQAALEGLVKAVQRFDPTIRPDLLTYAVPTIRGEVQRWFRDHSWTVRPPRRIQELQGRISRSLDRLRTQLGREPGTAELAADLDCSPEELDEALAAFGCFTPSSLDRPLAPGSVASLGDVLAAEDEDHSAVDARVMLAPVVRRLSERDRRILFLRFYEECTQAEIGDEVGISQMQVSRLLSRILRTLRLELTD